MNIDLDALANEFNMDMDQALEDVGDNQIDLESITENNTDNPDLILATNVSKANAILDRVIIEINRAGMSPRLGEVAGQLIATINQAANQIYSKNFSIGDLRYKKKMLELKDREVQIKEKALLGRNNNNGGTTNNNIIVSDRETLLRLMRENKAEIKLIEQQKEGEEDDRL